MAKKALISTVEPRGKNDSGYRVLEVVEPGNEFEVHSSLYWADCDDTVESFKYWWDPASSSFKKLPEALEKPNDEELASTGITDETGKLIPAEKYVWDWDNEVWTKEPI